MLSLKLLCCSWHVCGIFDTSVVSLNYNWVSWHICGVPDTLVVSPTCLWCPWHVYGISDTCVVFLTYLWYPWPSLVSLTFYGVPDLILCPWPSVVSLKRLWYPLKICGVPDTALASVKHMHCPQYVFCVSNMSVVSPREVILTKKTDELQTFSVKMIFLGLYKVFKCV